MAKKINKLSEVKKLTAELNSARKSLLNFRFQKSTGQLEKTSEIKKQKVILDSASRIADITSSYITLTKESRERNDTVHS